jgi:cleavage stimulation factor subunit 3
VDSGFDVLLLLPYLTVMADADAEATFLSSMQAMNEGTGEYNNDGGASGQQIDSPSSDEYDPAPDVQDVSLSSGPLYQPQFQQDSHADPSNNASSRTVSASAQPSPVTVNGVIAVATPANNLSLGDANGIVEQKPVQQLNPRDSSVPASHPAAPTSLASTTTSSEAGAAPHENSTIVPEPPAKDEKAMESPSAAGPSKARLPHDKIGLLEDRIKEDERGDMDAWLNLISEHRKRGKLDDARRVYEKFFSVFPSAVSSHNYPTPVRQANVDQGGAMGGIHSARERSTESGRSRGNLQQDPDKTTKSPAVVRLLGPYSKTLQCRSR